MIIKALYKLSKKNNQKSILSLSHVLQIKERKVIYGCIKRDLKSNIKSLKYQDTLWIMFLLMRWRAKINSDYYRNCSVISRDKYPQLAHDFRTVWKQKFERKRTCSSIEVYTNKTKTTRYIFIPNDYAKGEATSLIIISLHIILVIIAKI